LPDVFGGGLAGTGKITVVTIGLQDVDERLGALRVATGDEQGTAAAGAGFGSGCFEGAAAEGDALGGGEIEEEAHVKCWSSGKRLVNLTLVRGSAIMEATVSRQTW
jgi:hypothetical protein